ncbi:MAG TPA: carbohydrate kinase family protein [Trueperaceae bacterium]
MIVVAGHLCLDLIPAIPAGAALDPGKLVEVGTVSFATGGAVANVGLALSRLGLEPQLVSRIGDDPFGEILGSLLSAGSHAGRTTEGVRALPGESTSYSIVVNRPGADRTFLHHPGCNDIFSAADLEGEDIRSADLLYFGYPPLMQRIYEDGGESLAEVLAGFRRAGVTVALDMAMPDPAGRSGRVDWRSFLRIVLPNVDLFLPSYEEISYMLEPDSPSPPPSLPHLSAVAARLLELGPAVVGLKLGDEGLYLRTAGTSRLFDAGRLSPPASWAHRELLSPNFRVVVRGTTGAGDATIAGLLTALAKGVEMPQAAAVASAVGACSVEGIDAVSGVLGWQETLARMDRGWERVAAPPLQEEGWRMERGLLLGPYDKGGSW